MKEQVLPSSRNYVDFAQSISSEGSLGARLGRGAARSGGDGDDERRQRRAQQVARHRSAGGAVAAVAVAGSGRQGRGSCGAHGLKACTDLRKCRTAARSGGVPA